MGQTRLLGLAGGICFNAYAFTGQGCHIVFRGVFHRCLQVPVQNFQSKSLCKRSGSIKHFFSFSPHFAMGSLKTGRVDKDIFSVHGFPFSSSSIEKAMHPSNPIPSLMFRETDKRGSSSGNFLKAI